MARVSYAQAEKYYNNGGGGDWFQLKNDGDVARVQFIMNSIEDIPIFSAHKVKVGDRERYVDCLRSPEDPIDACPFCAAGMPTKAVHIIQMYQHDDNKVKIWERGRQFIAKLQGLVNRYDPLQNKVFEIERHGKAGDQTTKYEIYPLDGVDPVDLTDVDLPQLEGTLIMQKSAEEMEEYLDTGAFPESGGAPVRRRGGDAPAARAAAPAARRVPAAAEEAPAPRSRGSRNTGGRGTEVF